VPNPQVFNRWAKIFNHTRIIGVGVKFTFALAHWDNWGRIIGSRIIGSRIIGSRIIGVGVKFIFALARLMLMA